jgi:HEAT repeat protein
MRTAPFIVISIAAGLLASTAVAASGSRKYTRELEIIRSGLSDPDREVRSTAARYAGQLDDKGSAAGLKDLLTDPGETVRIKAAVALAKIGDRSGIPELRRIAATVPALSENPTPLERMRAVSKGTARAEAVRALGELRDRDSMPLLRRLSNDDDGRVADASLIALGRLGGKTVPRRLPASG